MISKNFLKSSLIYTLAGALPIASGVILLPLYAKYLPIDLFGSFALYSNIAMLIQVIVTFSFDSSVYIFFNEHKNDSRKLSVFVSSAFGVIGVLGLAISFLSLLIGPFLFDHLFPGKNISFMPFGLLSIATSVFQAFLKVHGSLLQVRAKPELFFWSNILSFSLIVGFTTIGMFLFPNTLLGPVGGRMAAAIISGVWVLWRIYREFGFHFNWDALKPSFRFNISSFIYNIQQWSITNFEKIIIGLYLSLVAVGIYDFAFKYLSLIDFIFGGLYATIFPKAIAIIGEQHKKETTMIINRYYYGIIGVTMLLACTAILCFPILVETGVIKSGYADSRLYVPFLSLVYLTRGIRIYFSLPYAALKYNHPLPFIYLVISIFKIGLMILLISHWQLFGVIISTILSAVIEIILLRFVIRNRFQFHFNIYKLIVAPALLALVIVILELSLNDYEILRHLFYLAFCCTILVWFYRNELKLIHLSSLFVKEEKKTKEI